MTSTTTTALTASDILHLVLDNGENLPEVLAERSDAAAIRPRLRKALELGFLEVGESGAWEVSPKGLGYLAEVDGPGWDWDAGLGCSICDGIHGSICPLEDRQYRDGADGIWR